MIFGDVLESALMLPLREINRRIVLGTLARHGGDKRQTAAALGVSLKTIYNCLQRYGVHGWRRTRRTR